MVRIDQIIIERAAGIGLDQEAVALLPPFASVEARTGQPGRDFPANASPVAASRPKIRRLSYVGTSAPF